MFRYLWGLENIKVDNLSGSKFSDIVRKYQHQIYEKFIQDLSIAFWKEYKKVLIQVPTSHLKDFLKVLRDKKQDSILKNSEVEIVEIDVSKISQVEDFEKVYQDYLKYIFSFDKFVEIFDTIREMESFWKNEKQRQQIAVAYANFMKQLLNWTAKNPKLKTYFPSQEQAELENMSLEYFCKLYLKVASLDWNEVYESDEELVKLFNECDEVEIIGENANIRFWIKWMKARNSVISANYPGSEVFSAPNKYEVNWWIYYPNEVYFKFTDDVFPNPYFEFKDWKLVKFEVKGVKWEEKVRLEKVFWDKIKESEWNFYLWELAFGTNPYVPVGLKHKLIGEKAFGMHFALWRAYKYEWVNNWNNYATIHWDAIRTLKDNIKVYFKKWNEKFLVIENWIYNFEICPKLYKLSLLVS